MPASKKDILLQKTGRLTVHYLIPSLSCIRMENRKCHSRAIGELAGLMVHEVINGLKRLRITIVGLTQRAYEVIEILVVV